MSEVGLQLDHVVVLVPYDTLIHPPAWITSNFTLSPGGRHADNKTENRLVLFQDGTYLEFIAFINDDPEKRKGHWWDKPYGVVDFALTAKKGIDHESLRTRLEKSGTGVSYSEPQNGGRVTDGKDIKWRVTFPQGAERGSVPFFCEDVTDRHWRVPVSKENTTHPSGALGMAGMIIRVKEGLKRLSSATAAIIGVEELPMAVYTLGSPNEVKGLANPTLRLEQAGDDAKHDLGLTLVLQRPGSSQSESLVREDIHDGTVLIDMHISSVNG
ncbi:hypothetical protein F5Y16DRAFT_373551 [Xylariaceae sp. FL0255]|nr:hypothetical protein F5Y16DRAFT_373551 [Xylariaceae sp. FL0255]